MPNADHDAEQAPRKRRVLDALVDRARGAGRQAGLGLRRAPAHQHGLAARERGNLEGAFWLLREAFEEAPAEVDVALAFWDMAQVLQRTEAAAPAGALLVEHHAAQDQQDLAAQFFAELSHCSPDAVLAPATVITILPALQKRWQESDGAEREEALALVRSALGRALDGDQLTPGVALRLFNET